MAEEVTGAITMRGNPMTLVGKTVKVGDAAPELNLTGGDMKPVTLDDVTAGGTRNALLIVVPSLDTGVCSLESKTFNGRVEELGDGAKAYVVSMDLPMAMGRWAGAEAVADLAMLSDFKTHEFGTAYGLRIKEIGLLARANVVIGKDKTIKYVEIVPEVTTEPNYDATIAATKAA
jgi:thiol peroxidase